MGIEDAKLTENERDVIDALGVLAGSSPELTDVIRRIVREEIASLAGKALRRTQDRNYTRNPERNLAIDVANEEMAEFWGEILSEYGEE